MKYIFSVYAIAFMLLCSVAVPSYVSGQITPVGPGSKATCEPGKLCNPLKVKNVQELILKLIDIAAQVGLVVCTCFIIIAGYKYVTAGGNPEKVSEAHRILLWSFVGTAVLLGAKVLASILANTVNQIIQ